MDVTLSDVSNFFSDMIQRDNSEGIVSNWIDAGSKKKQMFEEELSKALQGVTISREHRPSFEPVNAVPTGNSKNFEAGIELEEVIKKVIKESVSGLSVELEEGIKESISGLSIELDQAEGTAFLSGLKAIFLQISEGDLKNISIDEKGLDALEKLLLKAGFEKSDIEDLILTFSEKIEEEEVTLEDLLNGLFDFTMEVGGKTQAQEEGEYLEISAIPFIESIFTSLGIPKETTRQILSKADKGDKGISLDVVIESLSNLEKESFYTQNKYITQEGDDNFRMLLTQLQLETGPEKSSPFSLNELVTSLEQLRDKMVEQSALTQGIKSVNHEEGNTSVKETTDELLAALFKGLKVKNKETAKPVSGFSKEEIQHTFEDKIFVPDKGEKRWTGKNETGTGLQMQQKGIKELASLMEGKKEAGTDNKDSMAGERSLLKQFKVDNEKPVSSIPVSTLEGKTNEAQSIQGTLKTSASLKNLPSHVNHQVAKGLVRAVNQGENIVRINLKPPELGRLMMTIDNSGNTIKVSIMTENHAAKEILASNVNDLKVALSNSGVNLEKFEVDMSNDFRQSMADARSQSQQFGKKRKNGESFTPDHGDGPGEKPEDIPADGIPAGSHHFVA